jgi:hypothetical protein
VPIWSIVRIIYLNRHHVVQPTWCFGTKGCSIPTSCAASCTSNKDLMWFFKLSLFQFFHFAKQVPAGRTGPRQFKGTGPRPTSDAGNGPDGSDPQPRWCVLGREDAMVRVGDRCVSVLVGCTCGYLFSYRRSQIASRFLWNMKCERGTQHFA